MASKEATRYVDLTLIVISTLLVCGIIYYGFSYFEERSKWGIIFLSLCMIISSLTSIEEMGGRSFFHLKKSGNNVVAVISILLAVFLMIYMRTQHDVLTYEKLGCYDLRDNLVGLVALVLVFLFTWKDQGLAIPLVAVIAVLYMLIGTYLPGIFFHAGINWQRLLEELVLSIEGIYGNINQISATQIAIFLVFAGFLHGFGLLDYIIDVSIKLTGNSTRGIPQIAVVSSMIFGCFSGAASANVAATGSFTIPLMKRFGVPPEKAGGIEAVASTGGQIMPPVLGASAFVMADFLGTTYWHIAVTAFLPALIYYLTTVLSVYFITKQIDLKVIDQSYIANRKTYHFSYGIPFLASVIVFIVVMGFYKVEVMTGGSVLVVIFLAGEFIHSVIVEKDKLSALKEFGRKLLVSFKSGASYCAHLGVMIALLGVIVKGLVVTGLAQRLSFVMVDVSRGNLVTLLILLGVLCALFGVAVATLAAYLLVVLMAAPALQQLGVEPIVAHFVVFYLAILSAITPPVALASTVAAGIAGSGFLKTSWEAMKIGIALFILPYYFIYQQNILIGSLSERLLSFGVILLGMSALVVVLQIQGKRLKENMIRIGCLIITVLSFMVRI